MAFATRNLNFLVYANGFTLWHYRDNAEKLADIAASGFLQDAIARLYHGDMLLISANDGGRISYVTRKGGVIVLEPLS